MILFGVLAGCECSANAWVYWQASKSLVGSQMMMVNLLLLSHLSLSLCLSLLKSQLIKQIKFQLLFLNS